MLKSALTFSFLRVTKNLVKSAIVPQCPRESLLQPRDVRQKIISCNFCVHVERTTSSLETPHDSFEESDEEEQQPEILPQGQVLRVAIVGVPNSGKSTLINQILDIRVCSTSKKVHTTTRKYRAIFIKDDKQIVFLDTPGLVTSKEIKRHQLKKTFLDDVGSSIQEADMVAVLHDISNAWGRDRLDQKVLQVLESVSEKPAVLVLNKVDLLKSKRMLLDVAKRLTCGTLRSLDDPSSSKHFPELADSNDSSLEDLTSQDKSKKEDLKKIGWPGFSEIFMLSAVDGTGVEDFKTFLLNHTKPGEWAFPEDVLSDQTPQEIAEMAVREKILDRLPQEVPYMIKIHLELLEEGNSGALCFSVIAECPSKRCARLLMGPQGTEVRLIAQEAERALTDTFRRQVRLKIHLKNTFKTKKPFWLK